MRSDQLYACAASVHEGSITLCILAINTGYSLELHAGHGTLRALLAHILNR